jgi:hypothetical protein
MEFAVVTPRSRCSQRVTPKSLGAEFRSLKSWTGFVNASRLPRNKYCSFSSCLAERHALLSGDVVSLFRSGASAVLLLILTRFRVFGLELPIYNARMRSLRGKQTESGAEQGDLP